MDEEIGFFYLEKPVSGQAGTGLAENSFNQGITLNWRCQ
jgi:hypothetical protein